ncbi:MAG: stage III sporulation protein AA [Veillonellaceae bacterium]|jgi:stage III sporulation protein AA|nr:stage III sporulation protein AA [Veillonellaceae bacterium]
MSITEIINDQIFPILPPNIGTLLKRIPESHLAAVTEIRLRINKPLMLIVGSEDYMISSTGSLVGETRNAYFCTNDDISRTFQLISKNSIYALEQELKMGFLTARGGHRIGLTGQAIIVDGQLKAIKNINSLNIRLAREVKGCSCLVLPHIVKNGKRVLSTLIISPPRCGKTTILRDIIRNLSTRSSAFVGVQVGVVDERSEIAASLNGISTVDLGDRVDVLDGCPKSEGMLILIRSMSPQVIATDELGREEDAYAVREALNAGISVIATIHGRSVAEVMERPYVGQLIKAKYFERYIILSDTPTIGTIQEIVDARTGNILYQHKTGVKACG